MKTIYHIHNKICGHATNTLKEIVDYALTHEYTRLIFTEHSPLDNNTIIFRPSHEQVANLRRQIDKINHKYKGRLKIEFGYEIEYPKTHREYFHNFINDPQCDFLIFGNHFYGDMWKEHLLVMDVSFGKKQLDEYWENAEAAIKSGIFSLFAHPDIWMNSYTKWDKDAISLTNKLIKLCEKYDMPMGFNGNGMRSERTGFNYPVPNFWRLVAKSEVKVVIEADSHHSITFTQEWLEKVKSEAIHLGLKNNLVDDIKLNYLKHSIK